MKYFKNRTVCFWVGFAAAAVMLAADVVFVIVAHGDRTFSLVTFLFVLLGVACETPVLLKDYKFAPVLPALCFGVAFGMHLKLGLETLSDVVNDVNFVGGNAAFAIAFGIVFLLGTAAACVCCFGDQKLKTA